MANDRLYIVCRCGDWHMLYKFYPSNGYIGDEAEYFLNQHAIECMTGSEMPTFNLVWENKAAEITHMHVKLEDCDMGHRPPLRKPQP